MCANHNHSLDMLIQQFYITCTFENFGRFLKKCCYIYKYTSTLWHMYNILHILKMESSQKKEFLCTVVQKHLLNGDKIYCVNIHVKINT